MITVSPSQKNESELVLRIATELSLDCTDFNVSDFVVARKDDVILGIGRIKKYPDCIELSTIGVIPQEQNKGIGTLIINHLLKSISESIYLTCVIPNYFQRFGFEKTNNFPSSLIKKYDFCKSFGYADNEVFVMVKKCD